MLFVIVQPFRQHSEALKQTQSNDHWMLAERKRSVFNLIEVTNMFTETALRVKEEFVGVFVWLTAVSASQVQSATVVS